MKVGTDQVTQRVSHFREGLRRSGVKVTHQRLEIFREVARSGDHPDAEAVFEGVRARVPTVSLDTVYRTLWLLLDLRLIATLGPKGRARFDANTDRHHHFVCTRCGLTRDFYSDEFDRLAVPPDVEALGTVERMQVEVKGLCRRCATTT
jgi:Fur family peroxide stress response transcriptional regulator